MKSEVTRNLQAKRVAQCQRQQNCFQLFSFTACAIVFKEKRPKNGETGRRTALILRRIRPLMDIILNNVFMLIKVIK